MTKQPEKRDSEGVLITMVDGDSPFAGRIKVGDRLVSINGNTVSDIIDYIFYQDEHVPVVVIENAYGQKVSLAADKGGEYSGLGLSLEPIKIHRCVNKCIFCYVDQMPPALRKPLYIKDDDYRLSFIHGNYITLSNMTGDDVMRIVSQRLSPLYISVHSTDDGCRKRLLGNDKLMPIVAQLELLKTAAIAMHIQIVVVPGVNDGDILDKTIQELALLVPSVLSIAVVLVGVTRFSNISPSTHEQAAGILKIVNRCAAAFKKKLGTRLVFPSDDLLISAHACIPGVEEYEQLEQFENGVGMLAAFIAEFDELLFAFTGRNEKVAIITGEAFSAYLEELIQNIGAPFADRISVMAVENSLFGRSVTVAGLVCAGDIIAQVRKTQKQGLGKIFIPSVMLNDDGLFIDDLTIDDIKESLVPDITREVIVCEPTAQALLEAL